MAALHDLIDFLWRHREATEAEFAKFTRERMDAALIAKLVALDYCIATRSRPFELKVGNSSVAIRLSDGRHVIIPFGGVGLRRFQELDVAYSPPHADGASATSVYRLIALLLYCRERADNALYLNASDGERGEFIAKEAVSLGVPTEELQWITSSYTVIMRGLGEQPY